MMEQPVSCKCHNHVIFVTAFDYILIPDRTARLGNVFDTAFLCPLYIIAEGEKGIGTESSSIHLIQPGPFFFCCEYFRPHFKYTLSTAVRQYIHVFFPNVVIYGVVSVSPLDIVYERKFQYLWTLSQHPVICFLPGKPGTMYP